MMVIDGKTYFSLQEASKKTGYAETEIMDLIKGNKIEGELKADSWKLTDTGMKQLEIRKSRPVHQPVKQVVKIREAIEIKKQKPDPEYSVRFNTEKGIKVIEYAKRIAKIKKTTIKEIIIDLAEEGMIKRIPYIDKYEQINAERMKILEKF